MQSTTQEVTKDQANNARVRVVEAILEKCPGWQDAGVGISRSEGGYAVKLHLSHDMSDDAYDIVRRAADDVPVTTEITGEAWAF